MREIVIGMESMTLDDLVKISRQGEIGRAHV